MPSFLSQAIDKKHRRVRENIPDSDSNAAVVPNAAVAPSAENNNSEILFSPDVEGTVTLFDDDTDSSSEPPTSRSGSRVSLNATMGTNTGVILGRNKRGARGFYINSACDSSSTLKNPCIDDENSNFEDIIDSEIAYTSSIPSTPVPDSIVSVPTPLSISTNSGDTDNFSSHPSAQKSPQALSRTSSFTSILHPSAHAHRARHNHYHKSLPTLKQQTEQQQLEVEQMNILVAHLQQAQQQNMSLSHIISSSPSSSIATPMSDSMSVSIPALSSPTHMRNTPGSNGLSSASSVSSTSSSFTQMTTFGSYIRSPPDSPNLDPTSLCGSPNNLLLAPSPLSLSYINMSGYASHSHSYSSIENGGGHHLNPMSPVNSGTIANNTASSFSLNSLSRHMSRSSSSTTLPIQIPSMNINNMGMNMGSFKRRHNRKVSNTKPGSFMLSSTKENQTEKNQSQNNGNNHNNDNNNNNNNNNNDNSNNDSYRQITPSLNITTMTPHNNIIGLESPLLEPSSTPYHSVPMTPLMLSFDRGSLSTNSSNNNILHKPNMDAFGSIHDKPDGIMDLSLDDSLNNLTLHNNVLAVDDVIGA